MKVILGVNHQFLYPEAIVSRKAHTEALRELVSFPNLDALDCWVWRTPDAAREEIRILRESGCQINYNIGDRFGEKIVFPASADADERRYASNILRREIGFAMDAGAKKIILGSGPDVPEARADAKKRFAELLFSVFADVPKDVMICLEPTDRDMDKFFLFGPALETADFVRGMRRGGMTNFGMLLDMAHIPLMRETMESAVCGAAETISHIHLGNNIVSNPRNPMYGDKHVPFGVPDSAYTECDAAAFLKLLQENGYLLKEPCTVSFEVRPKEGVSAKDTWNDFFRIWRDSIVSLV